MEIRHFFLEGENIKTKIQNYIITKYPDGIIDVNDVLVCNSNRWSDSREVVMISAHFQFNFENTLDKVLVHLNLGGAVKLLNARLLRKQLDSQCLDFENWANKWGLKISAIHQGQYKTFSLPIQ